MKSYKQIEINVWKEYDYMPISSEEKGRVEKIITEELLELVGKFDGPAKVTITYEAKGNC